MTAAADASQRTRVVLLVLSFATLAAALTMRLYAAAYLVPIRTWDDAYYRMSATGRVATTPFDQVVRSVFLPNPVNDVGDKRTTGYHWCLVLGLELMPTVAPERVFQAVNVVLLLIQLGAVYGLASWSLRDRALAAAATSLYLMSPIVFGINRWVMTENFVMAGLTVAMCAGARLLAPRESKHAWGLSGVWRAVLAGVALGLFATLREYAFPPLVVLALATLLGLLIDRRWLAALLFTGAASPYLHAGWIAVQPAFANASSRMAGAMFFHPLGAWMVHVVMESWGPVLTFMTLAAPLFVVAAARRGGCSAGARYEDGRVLRGVLVLWAACGAVAIGMFALVAINDYRLVRPSIPIFLLWFGFALTGLRLVDLRSPGITPMLRKVAIAGVVIASAQQVYDLFLRFDGGAGYAHHPTDMEYYNHPLVLRPLRSGDDMHVAPDDPK